MIGDEPLSSQFHLLPAAPEGDAEELDNLTRNLRQEAEESDVERVVFVPGGDVSEGVKARLVTARSELNVTLKLAALPNLLSMVRDWLSRRNQRVDIVAPVSRALPLTNNPRCLPFN